MHRLWSSWCIYNVTRQGGSRHVYREQGNLENQTSSRDKYPIIRFHSRDDGSHKFTAALYRCVYRRPVAEQVAMSIRMPMHLTGTGKTILRAKINSWLCLTNEFLNEEGAFVLFDVLKSKFNIDYH